MKLKTSLLRLAILTLFSQTTLAKSSDLLQPIVVAQPTTCIGAAFSSVGDDWWRTITLRLTNNCGKPVDFQNTTVTFVNGITLNTNFWGEFNPLPYPDNNLQLTSQPQTNGKFLASLNMHFPAIPGTSTILPANGAISIIYGAKTEAHVEGTTNVYLGNLPSTGQIQLTNLTTKPDNVVQAYAMVHIKMNGENISDVQLPWNSAKTVAGLIPGAYALSADSVSASNGINYQGTVTPATVNVVENQTAQAQVAYQKVEQTGKIAIKLQALPSELSGYTSKPIVMVNQSGGSSSKPITLDWNTTGVVSQLRSGAAHTFSTPVINFNNIKCSPTFTPSTLTASEIPPTTNLTYSCVDVTKSRVILNIKGAPTNLPSLRITFTPNDQSTRTTQTVSLTNGSGSGTVILTTGMIYTLAADYVPQYSASFLPQPLTASNSATVAITLTFTGFKH